MSEEALFLTIAGQSQATGRDVRKRLLNTQFNYKGISNPVTGFPNARTTQEQYVASGVVPGVKIYFKTDDPSDDQSLDDGSWQDLTLGVNNCQNSGAFQAVGPELALCTKLHEYTGKTIHLIKCAFPGTALWSGATNSNAPGNWNNTNREIFLNYYIIPAMLDFAEKNPGVRTRLLGHDWWQGTHDALAGVSKALYKSEIADYRAFINDGCAPIFGNTVDEVPIWNFANLKFFPSNHAAYAAQQEINAAIFEHCNENPNSYRVITNSLPKCNQLTVAQRAPVALGNPNSEGGKDDNHPSYICSNYVGEVWGQNFIDYALA